MGWTKIRKIPKSIVQLQHLTCLHVRNLELPEGIGNLHALQELSDIKVNRDSLASSLLELGSLSKLRILGLCWCLVDVDSNKETLADNLVSSLRRLGRLNLRSLNIQNNYRYSRIDFLLDSWFPSPHLLQMFQMGMFYFFPRVPAWVASLDNLTYLDININPVQEEALEILGSLPALLVVWLTSRSAAPEQRLVVSSNMFISLKEFYFTCWSNGAGLMFEAGVMPRLEKLRVPFDARSGLDFGIQHLSSLRNLSAEIICMGATVREVEALEEAIRNTADLLPNCPTLEIRTWDDEHLMKEEQGKAEEEIQTSG